jgi:LPS sulfotransferase NodH
VLHFLGLGAQKCGSTWLCHNLSLHPRISFPGGKEVHFWDKRQGRELARYEALFDVPDGSLHGDITPAYAILSPAVIEECHRAFPDLRLIYIIRNPIDRAISHAKMDACVAGLQPGSLPDQWYVDHFHSVASRARGDYEACIKNWLSVYPEERLLLLFFAELQADPAALLGKCCHHLGLDNIFTHGAPLLTERIRPGAPVSLNPELRVGLHELYDEKISSLGRFLGRDLSSWRS